MIPHEQHRFATLDLYKKLQNILEKEGKAIPETLVKSHANLEKNRFLLAVVGKVKAGKSTFINALIGGDLMPVDDLQATSTIIQIFHSDKPSLKVTYANGKTVEINPDEGEGLSPLKKKLEKLASIQYEDRALPVAQLNNFIIENYNRVSGEADWTEKSLDLFFQTELDILELPPGDWREKSKDYLKKHRDGKDVAKSIEVGFPIAPDAQHFRIVDTPGIHAKGGLAERTIAFLSEVDAVIYLHKDEPSEKTLHDALKDTLPEKVKKHLLLVLTHKSNFDDEKCEQVIAEARRVCAALVPSDRIFFVDSLTEQALNAYHGKSWDEIEQIQSSNSSWCRVTAPLLYRAKKNRADLYDRLERQSNMRQLKKEIHSLSEKSLALQTAEVINGIRELYEELCVEAENRQRVYEQQLEDPQNFAVKVEEQLNEIEGLKAECRRRISQLKREYNLDNPEQDFGKKLDDLVKAVEAQINGKTFESADTAKTAYDFLNKINQDIEDDLGDLAENVKAKLQQSIREMEVSLQDEFDITLPKIPLMAMLSQAQKNATSYETIIVNKKGFHNTLIRMVTLGYFGNETKTIEKFNAKMFFKASQSEFLNKIQDIKYKFSKDVTAIVEKICTNYQQSQNDNLVKRTDFLEELKKNQQNNMKLQNLYEVETSYVHSLTHAISECKQIHGAL